MAGTTSFCSCFLFLFPPRTNPILDIPPDPLPPPPPALPSMASPSMLLRGEDDEIMSSTTEDTSSEEECPSAAAELVGEERWLPPLPLSEWRLYEMLPNSWRHGQTWKRNWNGGLRKPNQYRFPPLDPKDVMVRVKKVRNRGAQAEK